MKGAVIIGMLGLSLLPIWRKAPDEYGLNFWQFLGFTPLSAHLPYEEAVQQAREAFESCCPEAT